MKRMLVGVLVAMAAVGACGGSAPEGPKRLRFALIPKALDITVFTYANQGAQRYAAEQGNIEVIYRGPEKADELKQKEILESFISQGVDGIAISVLNGDFLRTTIDKAVDAGIPVVTWDSDAPGSKRFAFYGVDDFKSGVIMGEQAVALLGGKGTVALMTSYGAHNLTRRLEGVKDALAKAPGIKIVDTYDVQEDSVRAGQLIASGTNAHPDLGAWISVGGWPVFTMNALAPVPKTTKVISFDTNPPAPDLMKQGKVQVLLGQKYFGWGSESIRLLKDYKEGKRPPTAVIDSGVDIVTPANVEAYIAQWNRMAGGK